LKSSYEGWLEVIGRGQKIQKDVESGENFSFNFSFKFGQFSFGR